MARRATPHDLTVHQIVAHNVYQARRLRGWTQEEAAVEITNTLGRPMTAAGLSAVEKTYTSRRQRVIDVTELAAFARAFGLPIAWFFLPPADRAAHPIPRSTSMQPPWPSTSSVTKTPGSGTSLASSTCSALPGRSSTTNSSAQPATRTPTNGLRSTPNAKNCSTPRFTQFASDNSDLVETLLTNLAKLAQLTTTGHAATHAPKPDDPFGYLNNRVSVQRGQVVAGLTCNHPGISPRYRTRSTKKRPD